MSTKTVKTPVGKRVKWRVSLDGYAPQSGTYVMGDNPVDLNINLITYRETPLTMEFSGNGYLSNIDTSCNVQYNKNSAGWVLASSRIFIEDGDVIQFKGEYNSFYGDWVTDSEIVIDRVYGNIGSLLDPINYSTMTTYSQPFTFSYFFSNMNTVVDAGDLILPATTLTEGCYEYMFENCSSLTSIPELPAITLDDDCYKSMFSGCTSLTSAPALPATTLADNCYDSMFEDCTSLTTAPELPATTLTKSCYNTMFHGCTSLTSAPELPANNLVRGCYQNMFAGCSSLNYIKCLAHDISASYCTNNWVHGVALSGTFVRYFYNTDWTTGDNGIPVNWEVETVGMEQHTITINPTPVDAVVLINNVQQSSYTDWYGVPYTWNVSAPHYVSQSGSGIITGNETINVNLALEKHTFTIVPTPADATVIINGVERTTITADYGTAISWSVSKTGYVTQSNAFVLTENSTLPISLVLEQHTFTIVPTPADATVIINGVERTTITADYGTTINWSVIKAHYTTQTGSLTLTSDSTLPISLVLEQHTFAIVPTPADATITINGQTRSSITADYGTTITWSVSKEHYVTQSNTTTLTADTTLPVSLVLEQHTFAIVPTPADATITINGQTRSSITADYGTTINWSVSKAHYTTQSGTLTLTGNSTINVNLVIDQHTFTITPTPADAIVVINGVQRSTITADYGTTITWSVSKEHYVTQSNTTTLTADTTLPVNLALEQFTFSIVSTPSNATKVINGVARSSFTTDYGTTINWTVSKTDYTSESGSYVLYEDHVENVVLEPQTIIEGTVSSTNAVLGYNWGSGYYPSEQFNMTFTSIGSGKYRFVARASTRVTQLRSICSSQSVSNNAQYFLTITSVRGTEWCTSAKNMFAGCNNLVSIDMHEADFSRVTDVSSMFHGVKATQILLPQNLSPRMAEYMYGGITSSDSSAIINVQDVDWSNITYDGTPDQSSPYHWNGDGTGKIFSSSNVCNFDFSNCTLNSSFYKAFENTGKTNTPLIINMENTTINRSLLRIFGDSDPDDYGHCGSKSQYAYIFTRRPDPSDPNLVYANVPSALESGFWHYGYHDGQVCCPIDIGVFPWGNPNLGSQYIGEFYNVYSVYKNGSPIVTHGYYKTKYTNGYVSLNISGMTKNGIPDGQGGYVMPTVNFSTGPNGAYSMNTYNWKTGSSYRYNYWYNTTGTTIRYSVSAPGFNTVTGTSTPTAGSSTSTGGTATINITLTKSN